MEPIKKQLKFIDLFAGTGAFSLALDKAHGELINVGNNCEPITIKELADKIIKLSNSKSI